MREAPLGKPAVKPAPRRSGFDGQSERSRAGDPGLFQALAPLALKFLPLAF